MQQATVGERLRYFRESKGLTQRELSDLTAATGTPISAPLICNYEKGKYVPGGRVRRRLAEALGIDVSELNPVALP